jgi:hypothetical protein
MTMFLDYDIDFARANLPYYSTCHGGSHLHDFVDSTHDVHMRSLLQNLDCERM